MVILVKKYSCSWSVVQTVGMRNFTPTPQFSPHCPTGGVKISPLGRGAVLAMMFNSKAPPDKGGCLEPPQGSSEGLGGSRQLKKTPKTYF